MVEIDGVTYLNSEAAFQAQKCPERASEFANLTPREAKAHGRRVLLRSDWEKVKDQIMEDVVYAKFVQHPDLALKLIETGSQELIESNTWNDRYWGVCNGGRQKHVR